MAKRDRKALLIRIPTRTWKLLKKQAIQNNNTLTAEISEILEREILPRDGVTASSGANTVTILKD